MQRWKKILLWCLVILALLILGLVLLVRIYVTPERVHDLLQSGLENSLQRKVSLGRVDIGLLSGIKLGGLHIAARNGNEDLLSAEDIELTYDFKALLRGQLLFSRVRIKGPQLRLERLEDGSLNISDLLGSEPRPPAQVSEEQPPADKSAKAAIPLLVRQFTLEDGLLLFIDRKPRPASPYLHRLEHLNIQVDGFSLAEPFAARISAQINGAPLTLETTYALKDGLKTLVLNADKIALAPFVPYLQNTLPGRISQGTLSTALHLGIEAEGVKVRGQLVINGLDFTFDAAPPLPWKNMHIAFDQDLVYRFADQVLDVKMLTLDSGPAHLVYRGKIALAAPVRLAGEGEMVLADLRQLGALLPTSLESTLTSYGLAGRLDSSLSLEGEPRGLQVVRKASIKMTGLQASAGHLRPVLNGQLDYADQQLKGRQLGLDIKEQHFVVDLDATRLLSPTPQVQARLSGDLLDIDKLLPPAETKAVTEPAPTVGAGQPQPSAKTVQTSAEPQGALPLGGTAEFKLARVAYRGLNLTQVSGRLRLLKQKAVLEQLIASLEEGRIDLNGQADLSNPSLPFDGQLQVRKLALGPVADALLPEGKGSIRGGLESALRFAGQAADAELSDNLELNGNFDLVDGEIKGSPLFKGLATFLTNPQFEVLGFSRFSGNLTFKKGQGTIDSRLVSRQTLLFPRGSYSLAGPLDLAMETRIAPEVMSRTSIGGMGADLFKDDKGWSVLPLKVKGSYSKPRFTLDSSGLKKQLKEGVGRELGRQLQKKLGGDQPGEEPVQKLLDDTLKKLFGN